MKYEWIVLWSEEHDMPYYFNQAIRESRWERPEDLAWRRVKVTASIRKDFEALSKHYPEGLPESEQPCSRQEL